MARHPVAARQASGFTLVEILVVLAILATLIGLVAALIPKAMQAKQRSRAETLVNGVGLSLEELRMDNDQYGKYPPSRLKDLRIGKTPVGKDLGQQNDVNVGVECLYFLLNNPDIHARQVTADAELVGNTDEDQYRVARGTAQDTAAREYLDPWGQPLAYFHSNDYKDPRGVTEIRTSDGRKIEVKPKRLPQKAGGGYLNPNSFQLFSVGANGEQDPDESENPDDIVFVGR